MLAKWREGFQLIYAVRARSSWWEDFPLPLTSPD